MSTSGSSIAAQIALLIDTVYQQQHFLRSSICALAWLTYDIVLTIGQEAEHVWQKRWNVPKLLYLIGRYFGLLYLIALVGVDTHAGLSPKLSVLSCLIYDVLLMQPCISCTIWFWVQALAGPVIFTTTVNFLLILRINALYEQSRWIWRFLLVVFVSEFIVEMTVTSITISQIHTIPVPDGIPLVSCASSTVPKFTLASWIPCLVVACIFFLLTLFQFIRIVRDERRIITREIPDDDKVSYHEPEVTGHKPEREIQSTRDAEKPPTRRPGSSIAWGTQPENRRVEDMSRLGPKKLTSDLTVPSLWASRQWAPIAFLFVRDGTLLFFLIFAIVLINLILNVTISGPLNYVGEPWLIATYSIASSRLMLNLRALSSNTALASGFTSISAFRVGPPRPPGASTFDYSHDEGAPNDDEGVHKHASVQSGGRVKGLDDILEEALEIEDTTSRSEGSVYSSAHHPEV